MRVSGKEGFAPNGEAKLRAKWLGWRLTNPPEQQLLKRLSAKKIFFGSTWCAKESAIALSRLSLAHSAQWQAVSIGVSAVWARTGGAI